jgi:hypothetical protein
MRNKLANNFRARGNMNKTHLVLEKNVKSPKCVLNKLKKKVMAWVMNSTELNKLVLLNKMTKTKQVTISYGSHYERKGVIKIKKKCLLKEKKQQI